MYSNPLNFHSFIPASSLILWKPKRFHSRKVDQPILLRLVSKHLWNTKKPYTWPTGSKGIHSWRTRDYRTGVAVATFLPSQLQRPSPSHPENRRSCSTRRRTLQRDLHLSERHRWLQIWSSDQNHQRDVGVIYIYILVIYNTYSKKSWCLFWSHLSFWSLEVKFNFLLGRCFRNHCK